MLLHVSTFEMSSSGSSLCLANFILLRLENLYVILARHSELPEDDILSVETWSMLFVIIVFDIIVQSLVKIINNKECTVLVSK